LTAKKTRFWGALAGKQGVWPREKTSFFALFHVFVVFCICKVLAGKIFRKIGTGQKNRAKKPTVGFLFLGASGNILV
jgi:hypothetical protein